MFTKIKYPPGTVVQYRDDFAGDDRSYRVVFNWDEDAGTVDVKLTIVNDGEPNEMETISTERLKVIAYCDADGNLTWPKRYGYDTSDTLASLQL